MDASARREALLEQLKNAGTPVSAASLARKLGVSRQIIVGDVALLRASGTEILSTPRGYVLPTGESDPGITRRIACRHDSKGMQQELYAIVDQGCTILDVIVQHPLYGEITGSLQIHSRYEVDRFIAACGKSSALPLSFLTEGIHLHTIACPDESSYHRVLDKLREIGVLYDD